MRRSVLAMGAAGIGSIAADTVRGNPFSDAKLVGFAGSALVLALLANIEAIAGLVDIIAYAFVAVVVLSDGVDLIRAVTQ